MIKLMMPILLWSILNVSSVSFQGDIIPELAAFFKSANSKEIGAHFSPTVDLIVLEDEENYSKVQAEQIIRDFFTKHPPVSSTIIHTIDTNPNYRFCILSLSTRSGKFRVSVTLKKTGTSFFITELRIEADKS
jgi:hypothetical protein